MTPLFRKELVYHILFSYFLQNKCNKLILLDSSWIIHDSLCALWEQTPIDTLTNLMNQLGAINPPLHEIWFKENAANIHIQTVFLIFFLLWDQEPAFDCVNQQIYQLVHSVFLYVSELGVICIHDLVLDCLANVLGIAL